MQIPVSLARSAAIAAAVLFAGSLAGFGALLPAYTQAGHPVALLGATGVPNALMFNMLGFVLPGLLALPVTLLLRGCLDGASWAARLGAQLLLISGLAFAAQGLFPIDLRDPAEVDPRMQAAAWTVWWIAFAAGAVLLRLGARHGPARRPATAVALCATATLLFALLAPMAVPEGISQRLAFAGWFAAMLSIAWLAPGLSRSAVSG